MKKFDELANNQSIDRTIKSLKTNGISSYLVKNRKEAKEKALALIPKGTEVMTMGSETLRETGIADEIYASGKYKSIRKKLESMNREKEGRKMQQIGAAPEIAIGSAHAVTEDGKLMVVSLTGSQLPAYAYGADKVILVIGTQKIVKNLDEAMKRVYEYVFPLENKRAKKAYGIESSVNKILVINKEFLENRIHVIFVNEKLGF